MESGALDRYLDVLAEELGRDPGNLAWGQSQLFRGIDLRGRSVLDIGAGEGDVSFFAATAGASRVVSLEPEAAGSLGGATERFLRIRDRLGADEVELRPETLQEFEADGDRFDVLLSMASINHLDEDACTRLQDDPAARRTYSELLAKLADLANPGADLIVADAARNNFFDRIGRTNPISPTIEWEKHQSPQLWAELLEDAGFAEPRIRWTSFNTLRWPGRVILGNRIASYFLTSTFCLYMRKP